MSRRKQARPRLLKRDDDDDDTITPLSDKQTEEETKDTNNESNTESSKNEIGAVVAVETSEVFKGETSTSSSDLHCDVCGAKCDNLDQFMDHRNFECVAGQWTIDNLAANMSQLDDPPSSPESYDPSLQDADSPISMETDQLNPEDVAGGDGVSDTNPYGCQYCNKAFPRLRYLKIHEQIHVDHLPFQCTYCNRRFRHKRSLDRHSKLHTGDKKYKCNQCNSAFVRSDHLKAHLKTHSVDSNLQCMLCNNTFSSIAMLTSHMVSHSNQDENLNTKFDCTKCHSSFSSLSELQRHGIIHNIDLTASQKALHCSYCPEICLGQKSLEQHIQQKHVHRCPVCQHVASNEKELSQHIQCHEQSSPKETTALLSSHVTPSKSTHTPSKDLLVCPYCFYSDFSTLEMLEIHMQSVHSVKPAEVYTCNYCNAPYKNLYSLHEHMRAVHQNQPCLDIKYPCSLCGRQFGSIETLIQHKRALHPEEHKRSNTELLKHIPRKESHSKESMKAKQGGGSHTFPDRSYAVKHMDNGNNFPTPNTSRSITPQESITCEYCNATFYDFANFQTHMKHHLDNTFWCKLCNQKFPTEEQLESHALSHYLSKTTQFGCTCCIKMFNKPDELQKHLMDIHAHHLYRCALCKEIFDSKVNIQVHFAVKHSNECQLYQCTSCETVFRSEMEWQVHVRVSHLHVSQPYRCLFCKDSFTSEMNLQCHLTTHNKPLKCPMCEEAFNVEYLLDKHMHDVHSNLMVKKSLQGGSTSVSQTSPIKVKEEKDVSPITPLSSRIEVQTSGPGLSPVHSSGKWSTSPDPSQSQWASSSRESKSPWKSTSMQSPGLWKTSPNHSPSLWKTSELLHTCNICDVKFFHQSALQIHKAVDHRLTDRNHSLSQSPGETEAVEEEIKIQPLDESFQQINSPSRQQVSMETNSSPTSMSLPNIVNNEKLHSACLLSCMYCSQTFKNRVDLDKHLKIHLNSGSQKCNICDKIFATPGILAEHKLMHCKIQQGNTCILCKMPLKSEEEFYLHSQEHGGQSSYMQCLVCRQTLVSLTELQMHGKHHFQVKVGFFSCCVCRKTFDSRENLIVKENINSKTYFVCKPCYHGEKEEFSCNECNAKFLTIAQLEEHSEMHRKSYQCIKCQESFSSEHEIQMHVASHVMKEGNVHECKLCSQKFESPAKLQCHLIEHTYQSSDIRCSVCCKVFESPAEIQQHAVEHGPGSKRYSCTQCNQKFFFSAELQNHKFCHDNKSDTLTKQNDENKTEKSNSSTSNSLLKQALSTFNPDGFGSFNKQNGFGSSNIQKLARGSSSADEEFKCSHCNKSFSMMINLTNHMKIHEKREQNFKCSLCSKTLSSMAELQKHFYSHHSNTELDEKKKVFKCPKCDEEFPCQSNLIGHMRIHNSGAKFPCAYCPKVFALSRNLTIHMRYHSGEKPYECPICHKHFARKENRKAHLRSHGGIKPFLCPICGKSFSRKCHVKEHMKCHFTQDTLGDIDESSILEVDVNSDNASIGSEEIVPDEAVEVDGIPSNDEHCGDDINTGDITMNGDVEINGSISIDST